MIASIFAFANALWTTLLLGGAVLIAITCEDNSPTEQQCGASLGLGFLWVIGQLVLLVPTGWASNVLVRADEARPVNWVVRFGLAAVAVTLAIPAGIFAIFLLAWLASSSS